MGNCFAQRYLFEVVEVDLAHHVLSREYEAGNALQKLFKAGLLGQTLDYFVPERFHHVDRNWKHVFNCRCGRWQRPQRPPARSKQITCDSLRQSIW